MANSGLRGKLGLRKDHADITGQVALLILFDAVAWLKEAGYAGVVGGKQNIQWVEFVLGRSDEYWEG